MYRYVHALGVLPLFDAGSIPNSLIVDGRRRCFLVRALAHPDDRVSQAAAHALQRVVIHHAQLRVKVLRPLLCTWVTPQPHLSYDFLPS